MMILALAFLVAEPATVPLHTLEGHARRGAVFTRLDGIAAESAPACQSACGLNNQCLAWTWNAAWPARAARCDLHGMVMTPRPQPGATTGLSPALVARIDAAIDREPTRRERDALDEASGGGAGGDGLVGG